MESDSPEVKIVKFNTCAVKENSDILKRLQWFSSWLKTNMAVVLCLRYKRRLRDKVLAKRKLSSNGVSEKGLAGPTNVTSASTGVNVADLEEAEVEIIKHVQRNEFPSEMKSLQDIQAKAMYGSHESDKEKKALFKNTSSLCTLDPVLDSDGVMRVGGRIWKANLPCTLKNPIILPKSGHITSLIISHTYCGVNVFGPWHVQRGRAVEKRHRTLFFLLSEQSSAHRTGRFLRNGFIYKCIERFHL